MKEYTSLLLRQCFGAAGLQECSVVFLNVTAISRVPADLQFGHFCYNTSHFVSEVHGDPSQCADLSDLPMASPNTVHKAVQLCMCNKSNAAQILSMDSVFRPHDSI